MACLFMSPESVRYAATYLFI